MGVTLTGKTIKSTYKGLLKFEDNLAVGIEEITKQFGESHEIISEALETLIGQGVVLVLDKGKYIHQEKFDRITQDLISFLNKYHLQNPLEVGVGKQEVRNKLFKGIKKALFENYLSLLKEEALVKETEGMIAVNGFEVVLTDQQHSRVQKLLSLFREAEYMPPTLKSLNSELSKEDYKLLVWMIQQGLLEKISSDIYFEKNFYLTAKRVIINYIEMNGRISVKDIRELLETSRKYSVPLLEHLDEEKITRRMDDFRVLF
jgi:selenocysteine-specific elongation factor